MSLYDKYSDIDDLMTRQAVDHAISNIKRYCGDIGHRLTTDFTITIENKTMLFFDIRHSIPHYYIEILRDSGIISVKGYDSPIIKIIGGGK